VNLKFFILEMPNCGRIYQKNEHLPSTPSLDFALCGVFRETELFYGGFRAGAPWRQLIAGIISR